MGKDVFCLFRHGVLQEFFQGPQDGTFFHLLDGKKDFVVPVHIRLKIMECDGFITALWKVVAQMFIQEAAPLANSRIPDQKAKGFRQIQELSCNDN